ncbi:type VI secretion system lipoprotein TssJ [Paraburkholderia aspalathi]|uniref:type VI secretion system lipoprotein TssJ n=1 Tax=Paraburkholderia aspalathi TaxID=1324617 RepID=UPI0038B6F4C6
MTFQTPARIRVALARVVRVLVLPSLSCALVACAGAPERQEQIDLDILVSAGPTINRDEMSRPAPVMVRLYELKSAAIFDDADFYTLQNDGKRLLGDDALTVDEFILRPGERRHVHRLAHPGTTVIGVLAGYRVLDRSVWRTTYHLPSTPDVVWYRALVPRIKAKLTVDLGDRGVSVTELN